MVVNCARKKLANFFFNFAIILLVLLTVPLDAGALQEAVERGQDKIVAILLQQHAETSHPDLSELLLLSCCGTTEGHARVTELLLEHGADLHAEQMIIGGTPLHVAALCGATESARILLERGAQVDMQDCGKQTPLHGAAEGGHADIVRLLLERGANVDAQDKLGESPLVLASHARCFCPDVVGLLLAYGADIDARNGRGETPLHRFAQTIRGVFVPDKKLVGGLWEITRVLLLHGADLNDAVRQQLQGVNSDTWREILREERKKMVLSDEEHRRFTYRVEQDKNTLQVFDALCLLRDRQIDAFRAYSKHLHLVENMPKELVVLVQNFALSKAQKELMIEQKG